MTVVNQLPLRVESWKPKPATDEDLAIFAAAAVLAGHKEVMTIRGKDIARLLDRIAKAEGRL